MSLDRRVWTSSDSSATALRTSRVVLVRDDIAYARGPAGFKCHRLTISPLYYAALCESLRLVQSTWSIDTISVQLLRTAITETRLVTAHIEGLSQAAEVNRGPYKD